MYNFSNEAKKRIINGKITRAYLKVLATDNLPEIIIDESNYLKDFTFEDFRYVPDEGFIGGTVAKSITGNFNNIDNSFSIQDREFELYLGVDLEDETTEYIKYGTFIVQKPEDDQVTDNTSFEALDYMIKLNLPWEDRMTYPCTLKQLFDDLVEQSGLKTKVTTFLNEDFIVENNQFEEGTTRRDVLKAIAQAAFNWARIDEDDNIVMDFEIKDNVEETLTPDNYFNLTKQEIYGPINVIIFKNSQVEGENVTIKDEESINAGKGKNKFDKDNIKYTKGYYLDKDGNEVANDKWQYTDYIKVDSYDITLSEVADKFPAICGYDENKNFIVGKNYDNQAYVTLTSDKKIKYIRFSVNIDWLTLRYNYHTLNFPIFIGDYPYIGKMQLEEGKERTEYEAFIANGETELVISDNPLAYNQAKRAELIEAGKKLFGLKYTPISMDTTGYIYLDCKNKIAITNLNNEKFETYVFNHTINYDGVVLDSIESPASTKTETKYQYTSDMIKKVTRTEILVDKANQKIQEIVEEQTNFSEKISSLTVSLNDITAEINNFYDFTKQVSGINEILLEDALNMDIIKFEATAKTIKGIYPRSDLYPSQTLYPKKGGTTITVVFARTSRDVVPEPILPSKTLYPNSNLYPRSNGYYKTEFEFYVKNPLRNYLNLNDKFIIELDQDKGICVAKVIRYIDVDENGEYIVLDTPREEIVEERHLPLYKGNNYVYIKEFRDWDISATYIFNNELNKDYALRVETNSKLKIVEDEINLEVSKKVNQDEIIASINLSPEEIKILAKNLQLEGFTSINGNFTIDEEGNMICNNATIKGTTIANGQNFSVDEEGNLVCRSATMENVICDNFTIKNSTIQEGYIELKSTDGNSSFSVTDTSTDRLNSELSANLLNFNSNLDRGVAQIGVDMASGYGFVSIEGNVYANNISSDERLKENIVDSEISAIETLKKVEIKSFDWKESKEHVDVGIIAQQVEKINSNFVLKKPILNKDKEIIDYKYYINELPIISTLIKAVQEQQEIIESIKKS